MRLRFSVRHINLKCTWLQQVAIGCGIFAFSLITHSVCRLVNDASLTRHFLCGLWLYVDWWGFFSRTFTRVVWQWTHLRNFCREHFISFFRRISETDVRFVATSLLSSFQSHWNTGCGSNTYLFRKLFWVKIWGNRIDEPIWTETNYIRISEPAVLFNSWKKPSVWKAKG